MERRDGRSLGELFAELAKDTTTTVLQEVADEWLPAEHHKARDTYRGTIYISESRLSMSRSAPLPGA